MTGKGVNVYEIRKEKSVALPVEETILITNCADGVRFARRNGVGFLGYEDTEEDSAGERISYKDAICIIQGFDGIHYEFLNHMYERTRGIPWTILETERCRVREIRVEDLKRLYEIYEDPSITAYMEGLYNDPKEEEEFTRAYIKNMYGFYGFGMWIVEEKEDERIIGRAGITIRDGFDDLELGYLIAAEYQRKGYAEEVCRAIIEYAHNELGSNRLNAFIDAGNEASIRLCEKLGFCHVGQNRIEQKNLERYQLIYKKFTNSKKTVDD